MKEFEKVIIDISTPKAKENAYKALKMFDQGLNDVHLQHNSILYFEGFYSIDTPQRLLALLPKDTVIYPSAFKQMLARKFLKAGQLIVVKSECGKEFIIQFDSIVNNKIFRGYKSGEEFLFNIAGSFVRFANAYEWKEFSGMNNPKNPTYSDFVKKVHGEIPKMGIFRTPLTEREKNMLDEMLVARKLPLPHFLPFVGDIFPRITKEQEAENNALFQRMKDWLNLKSQRNQSDDKFAELKKANAEGKVIQHINRGDWMDLKNPRFVDDISNYRIKPEEKPKVGDIVGAWNSNSNAKPVIGKLEDLHLGTHYGVGGHWYDHAKTLTKQEVVELLFGKEFENG